MAAVEIGLDERVEALGRRAAEGIGVAGKVRRQVHGFGLRAERKALRVVLVDRLGAGGEQRHPGQDREDGAQSRTDGALAHFAHSRMKPKGPFGPKGPVGWRG